MIDSSTASRIGKSRIWVRFGSQTEPLPIATDTGPWQRGDRIVFESTRGLELGIVVGVSDAVPTSHEEALPILSVRRATAAEVRLADELTVACRSAIERCQSALDGLHEGDVLLEIEPMLDGATFYFHFLGEPSFAAAEQLPHLSEICSDILGRSALARVLEPGCGAGCGTSKGGCGTGGGCGSCSAAGRCTKRSE
jgi:hypothetical protein